MYSGDDSESLSSLSNHVRYAPQMRQQRRSIPVTSKLLHAVFTPPDTVLLYYDIHLTSRRLLYVCGVLFGRFAALPDFGRQISHKNRKLKNTLLNKWARLCCSYSPWHTTVLSFWKFVDIAYRQENTRVVSTSSAFIFLMCEAVVHFIDLAFPQ